MRTAAVSLAQRYAPILKLAAKISLVSANLWDILAPHKKLNRKPTFNLAVWGRA